MKLSYPIALLAMVGVAFALPTTPDANTNPTGLETSSVRTTEAKENLDDAGTKLSAAADDVVKAGKNAGSALVDKSGETKNDIQTTVSKNSQQFVQNLQKGSKKAADEVQKNGAKAVSFIKQGKDAFLRNVGGNAKWQNDPKDSRAVRIIKQYTPGALAAVGGVYSLSKLGEYASKHRAPVREGHVHVHVE